jgi:hypothetical protein
MVEGTIFCHCALLVENIVHSLLFLLSWFVFPFFITQITVHYIANHVFGFILNLLMEILCHLLILVVGGNQGELLLTHLTLLGLCNCAISNYLVDLLIMQVTRHCEIICHFVRLVVYLFAQVISLSGLDFLLFLANFVIGHHIHLGMSTVEELIV